MVHELKNNVRSLKAQCATADEKALEKAIEKLSFSEKIAVRSCFATSKVKSLKGMRYETQWVYGCLLLRIKSKKVYEHLRRRRILILPNVSTLNRYIKKIGGFYRFQENMFKVMQEKTYQMKTTAVRGVLLLDMMKLTKCGLYRQKLKVEGFTDSGDLHPHMNGGRKETTRLSLCCSRFMGNGFKPLVVS